jgi:carbon storage regulator CsrA
MLALARGEGQSIIIDGNIEVKIVKWSRSSVRLAIQAPREVTVDRDEIWRKMHPGEMTPLEKAEKERQERFAREGTPLSHPHATPPSPRPSPATSHPAPPHHPSDQPTPLAGPSQTPPAAPPPPTPDAPPASDPH